MNKHRERLYRAIMRQPLDRPLTAVEKAKVFRMGERRILRKRFGQKLYITRPVLNKHLVNAPMTEDFSHRL